MSEQDNKALVYKFDDPPKEDDEHQPNPEGLLAQIRAQLLAILSKIEDQLGSHSNLIKEMMEVDPHGMTEFVCCAMTLPELPIDYSEFLELLSGEHKKIIEEQIQLYDTTIDEQISRVTSIEPTKFSDEGEVVNALNVLSTSLLSKETLQELKRLQFMLEMQGSTQQEKLIGLSPDAELINYLLQITNRFLIEFADTPITLFQVQKLIKSHPQEMAKFAIQTIKIFFDGDRDANKYTRVLEHTIDQISEPKLANDHILNYFKTLLLEAKIRASNIEQLTK